MKVMFSFLNLLYHLVVLSIWLSHECSLNIFYFHTELLSFNVLTLLLSEAVIVTDGF